MSSFIKQLEQLYLQKAVEAIDVERCRYFQQQTPDISDNVLKAVFLAGYRFRQGDVCLMLEEAAGRPFSEEPLKEIVTPGFEQWTADLTKSSFVGRPGDFKPLILDKSGRLYFQKYWRQEENLAQSLLDRCEQKNDIDETALKDGLKRLFGNEIGGEPDWQKAAATLGVKNKLLLISGGPGTGKTTTVVRILALIAEQSRVSGESAEIALAAPTGKAAARLKESVRAAKQVLNTDNEIKNSIPDEARTLHQLLGARRNSARFKYNEQNVLPYQTIVLDEASMADQTLMNHLMKALRKDARLILLGDKDQLASVEAGSVLGDICFKANNIFSAGTAAWLQNIGIPLPEKNIATENPLVNDFVTLLTKNYRFGENSGIGQLARNINAGNVKASMRVIESGRFDDVNLTRVERHADLIEELEAIAVKYFIPLFEKPEKSNIFKQLRQFQLLAVHRQGPYGVQYLNERIEHILSTRGLIPRYQRWYAGRPVIINTNDYNLKLYNGDIGVCLPDKKGKLQVYFQKKDEIRAIAPARLVDCSSAYVLTVHKSQGDEFESISLILPSKESKVLSRELLYTAVTRARKSVNIIGAEAVLKASVKKKIKRSSGLAHRLWEK